MNRIAGILAFVVLVGALAGCNTLGRQPKLENAVISPAELKPGESAVVSVKVVDRHDIVKRVEGVVQEDPNIRLKLRDDGGEPDVKASDNVWTLQVDVPEQALPGTFMLELIAYRSDGTPVPVRNAEREVVNLATFLPVVIANP